MKLRIHGDSIRLRLSRSEVADFGQHGRVEDTVHFGPGVALVYALESAPDAGSTRAVFDAGAIRIIVPSQAARQWTTTDQEGITAEETLDNKRRLSIVVEKDFKCIHKPGDADEDAFPNPLAARN